MERRDAIPLSESENALTHGLYVPGNVVAMVHRLHVGSPVLGLLPVLGVGAGDDGPDEELAGVGDRDGDVADFDLEGLVVDGGLHFGDGMRR